MRALGTGAGRGPWWVLGLLGVGTAYWLWRRSYAHSPEEEEGRGPTPGDWERLTDAGTRCFHEGSHERALELFRQSLEACRSLPPEDRRRAVCWNNLGAVHRALGALEDAEQAFREALRIRRACFGPHHVLVAQSLRNLGEVCRARGQREEAEALYRECMEVRRGALETSSEELLAARSELVTVLLEREAWAAAEEELEEIFHLWNQRRDRDQLELVPHLDRLALAQRKQGRADEAVDTAGRALDLRDGYPLHHTERVTGLVHLALCLEEAGRTEGIRDLLEAAVSLLETQLRLLEREGDEKAAALVRKRLASIRARL